MAESVVRYEHPELPLWGSRNSMTNQAMFWFPYNESWLYPGHDFPYDRLAQQREFELRQRIGHLANPARGGYLLGNLEFGDTSSPDRPDLHFAIINGSIPGMHSAVDRLLIDSSRGGNGIGLDIAESYGRVALAKFGAQIGDVYGDVMPPRNQVQALGIYGA